MSVRRFFRLWVSLTVAVALCFSIYGASAQAPSEDERVRGAAAWLEGLVARDYAEAEARLDETMKSVIDEQGGLAAIMDALELAYGEVTGYGEPAAQQSGDYLAVVIPVELQHASLNAQVALDAEDRVAGLMFMPRVEADEEPVGEGVIEEEVTVDAGTGYPLGGTLSLPEGAEAPLPAALLVWGSGANGRDEPIGANRVFAQLANALAERGIAVLRFDKRTYTYPELGSKPGFTVKDEYIEDVLAAVALLKGDARVDAGRVFIVGHSQGGMLAPRFVEAGADVKGLVLLAGTPRNLSDVLYDQELNTLGELKDDPEATKVFDDMRAEAEAVYAGTEEQALAHAPLYSGMMPAYYLYEMSRYDAIELITSQRTPVLVLQGGNDWQVLADGDYSLYEAALRDEPYAQLKLYPGLNHAFMPSEAANLSEALIEYNRPARIPDEVLDDIAAFVLD